MKTFWRAGRPLGLIATTALLFSPGLWLGAPLDSAVFVLAGERIRGGLMPYAALWDHKPPGTFLINAAGQVALPWMDPWLVCWLLTVAAAAATILLIDRLLWRRVGGGAAYLWSLVCLLYVALHPVGLGGGATETFALLPLVSAVWVVATGRSGPRWGAAIGLLLAASVLCSVQALPAAFVVFVAAIWGDRDLREIIRRGLPVVAAGVAPVFAILGWLAAGGALGDAFDEVVRYNAAYKDSSSGLGSILPIVLMFLAALALPVAAEVARMCRRPRAFDRLAWMSLAWAAVYSAWLGYQGRIYLHYLVLLVPPLAFLAAQGFRWMVAQLRSGTPAGRRTGLSLAGMTAIGFMIAVMVGGLLMAKTLGMASDAKTARDQVAAWIRGNTAAATPIFIWSSDPGLYLEADRAPYDEFVYQFPLVTAGYWSLDRSTALATAWAASPPRVIVEGESPVPMFRAAVDTGDNRKYDSLQPLRDFVKGHYRLTAHFEKYDVYELIAR